MGCSSTAGHWDPEGILNDPHNAEKGILPAGDLLEAVADKNGDARIEQSTGRLTLFGPESIVGRALVIHKNPDSAPMPNPRIACCTIGLASAPKKDY